MLRIFRCRIVQSNEMWVPATFSFPGLLDFLGFGGYSLQGFGPAGHCLLYERKETVNIEVNTNQGWKGLRQQLSPENARKNLNFFLLLNAGLFITAAGIHFFKTPNHFAFGGTSGLSIILSTLFPTFPVGTFMWIVNAVLVVLGFVFLGIRAMGWTIYSSFAISFFVSLCEGVFPLQQALTDDTFLELCFAVILPAVGSAIVFNIGASTGGTDIVAMILNKYTSLEIGRALMVSDLGIVLVAAYLYGPKTGLYCILGMILKSTVVDSAIESLNLRKVCTVVTHHPEPVRNFIVEKLNRSATEQLASGAYTHEETHVLMTVLTRHQAAMLRNFLRATDPHAFITIVNSSEIIGKGFRAI